MQGLRIATRASPLAVWQAEHVGHRLEAEHPGLRTSLVRLRTEGDKLLDAPLARVGGKGLFVKELERAILDGRADIAVHSMKDVPVAFPDGLHLPVILRRGDPRDALVSRGGCRLSELPEGAVLGTASLRRRGQLAALRPDCTVVNLRGNVQTRLAKLEAGQFDATVLALSGLERLELAHLCSEVLAPSQMLPAIGQGALGVECRVEDERVNRLLEPLDHRPTWLCVQAERTVNGRLGGGCQAPVAAFATLSPDGKRMSLQAMTFSLDGRQVLRAVENGTAASPKEVGERAARSLIDQGARELLQDVFAALESEMSTGSAPTSAPT